MGQHALVAYFSASGTTARAAARVAAAAKADLFEIVPAQRYTRADLNWNDSNSRSSREMNDPASRPAVSSTVPNMEQYDTVWIGFPIWWYVAPTIIQTFLERYDFAGKTVIPFATSGGSGFGDTVKRLKPSCSDKAKWMPGRLLNRASDEEIACWVRDLGR